ncbi:MAG: hypothetical protein BGO70_06540 [Bacteroidetes bacterium 43-93]|nr:phosphatase PAP2 family protein [Bacteroidota bacterium]OJW97443.1 MAG: hypothetical protein BGO70_06540 [Bacteroidetes bacterium 43-93]
MEKIVSFAACCLICLLCCFKAPAQNADIRMLRSVNVNRNTGLDGAMNAITQTAYPVSFALPAAELIAGYITRDKHTISNGWQSVAGAGITVVVAYGLKYAVNRQRPYLTYPDIQPYSYDNDPCFPSGHTSLAFCTATSLTLHYPRWYVAAPAYLWATGVGYSRLHLGMHYPSDVLAGAIVGAGSAWLSYKGNQWLQKRKHKKVNTEIEGH